jgi:hypothetical protein
MSQPDAPYYSHMSSDKVSRDAFRAHDLKYKTYGDTDNTFVDARTGPPPPH